MQQIRAGETDPALLRVYFLLVAPDGITPAEGEGGGQPTAILSDDTVGTSEYIGTLVRVTANTYYAVLTAAAVASDGTRGETRYESAGTAEQIPGDSFTVVAAPTPVETLSADGLTLEVVRGVSYRSNDARAITWRQGAAAWPDLSADGTAVSVLTERGVTLAATASGADPDQAVTLELTAAHTLALGAGIEGWTVRATQADGDVIPLVEGVTATVR